MNKPSRLTGVSARATGTAASTRNTKDRARRHSAWAPRRSSLSLALAVMLGCSWVSSAQAVDLVWTGAGSNSNWTTTLNWTPGVPTAIASSMTFNNKVRLTQVVDVAPAGLIDVLFGTNAGAYTFNASPTPQVLGVAGNITNFSGQLQTFNVQVQANGVAGSNYTPTWDGGSAGMTFANAWLADASTALTLVNKVAISQGTAVLGGVTQSNSTLNITAGSSATTGTLMLGRDFASQGTVLVDGPASRLTNAGDLVIGYGSTGTVTVQNGGVLNSGNTFLGTLLGGDGLAVISGPSASWVSTGNLNIGDAGGGSLRVEAGARLTNVGASFGNLDGGAGTAKVTGANSSWVLSGDLQIGSVGEGTLFIDQGGLVSNRQATVGQVGDAGTSKVAVTGAGSRWQSSGDLVINSGGLELTAGGLASAQNGQLGQAAGSIALVTLAGAGSTLTVTGTLAIGSDTGSATVNLGKGATLNSGAQLVIGKGGVLNLNGGTLNTGWSFNQGQVNWNTGTVNFLGTVSTGGGILSHSVGLGTDMNMVVQGALQIQAGDGVSLNGGQVQADRLTTFGDLSVGSFSQLSVGPGGVYNGGALQLAGGTLSSAGSMLNANYLVGYGVIAGAGGFSNTGLLRQSGGSLNLAAMGSNVNTGNWDMLDGRGLVLNGGDLLNAGVMTLSGDTVSGGAWLVNGSTGTLSGRGVISTPFQNDGRLTVDAGSFRIDQGFANNGQILMGSAASTLSGNTITNNGRIYGMGQVNNAIVNTGTVAAVGGVLTLEGGLANSGVVSAGQGATLLLNHGLASNGGRIQLAGGTFDNNGFAMTNEAGGVVSGFGSLSGGLLTNKGQMLLSGGNSRINSDVLSASASQIILSGNSNSTFYGNVDVQSGAELRVSTGSVATFFGTVQQRTGSKFTGAGAKRFEGTLSVGASPGLGTDGGDVEFGDSSTYLAEIGGITACTLRCDTDVAFKNSSFDKYIVAGNLTLNGTLKLTSWNGFVASAGQSFDLLDWGTLTGTFANIDASGFMLAQGTQLDYSQLYTNGSILVTTAAVPEPEPYALLLSGLAVIGTVARRRLNNRA